MLYKHQNRITVRPLNWINGKLSFDNNYDYFVNPPKSNIEVIPNNGYLNDTSINSGWWYLKGNNHLIEPGGNYKMLVNISGHPPMTASCIVPEKVEIQHIDTASNFNFIIQKNFYLNNCKLTFSNPPGQQHFYALESFSIKTKSLQFDTFIYYNNTRVIDVKQFWYQSAFYDNPFFENHCLNSSEIVGQPFFSDKLFNGNLVSVNLTPVKLYDSMFCVNLVSISQGYYERLKSEYLYYAATLNNYSTPVDVFNNFTNAIGFLAGRTVSSDTFYITSEPVLQNIVHTQIKK